MAEDNRRRWMSVMLILILMGDIWFWDVFYFCLVWERVVGGGGGFMVMKLDERGCLNRPVSG